MNVAKNVAWVVVLAAGLFAGQASAQVLNREFQSARKVTLANGVTMVRLNSDENAVLQPGDVLTITNVRFRGGRIALVMAAGDEQVDGDLDVEIIDERTGARVAVDNGPEKNCATMWTPNQTGPFTIRVLNPGRTAQRFIVAANWNEVETAMQTSR